MYRAVRANTLLESNPGAFKFGYTDNAWFARGSYTLPGMTWKET